MKISKIVYLFVALAAFNNCFGMYRSNLPETVIKFEQDQERLRAGIPPIVGHAETIIANYQSEEGLTREDAVAKYFENIDVDNYIEGIEDDIKTLMKEFKDEDWDRYFELKSQE